MSRRARELGALNLGQGFPDYDIDPRLIELVTAAMATGHNQYAPMEGTLALREQIAQKIAACYAVAMDPESEITITLGATEAHLFSYSGNRWSGRRGHSFRSVLRFLRSGRQTGGCKSYAAAASVARFSLRLGADARGDNGAHPPCHHQQSAQSCLYGSVCMRILTRWPRRSADAILPSCPTRCTSTSCSMAASTVRCSHTRSCGREALPCFHSARHCMRPGCALAIASRPRMLTRELRKVHQFNTFSIAHPFQHAIAPTCFRLPRHGRTWRLFFRPNVTACAKRLPAAALSSRLPRELIFSCSISVRSMTSDDGSFAERLFTEAGVATIPLSPFYARRAASVRSAPVHCKA